MRLVAIMGELDTPGIEVSLGEGVVEAQTDRFPAEGVAGGRVVKQVAGARRRRGLSALVG